MKPTSIALRADPESSQHAPAIPTPLEARMNGNAAQSESGIETPGNKGDREAEQNGVSGSKFKIVIVGLSINSSWNNGHSISYRGLVRQLCARGHDVLLLERDAELRTFHRDLQNSVYGRTATYRNLNQLKEEHALAVRKADLVIVGPHGPGGTAIGEWVTRIAQGATAFCDIDTPVTIANLSRGNLDYLTVNLIPKYDIYLSSTGGPTLGLIEDRYHSRMARPLYCSVDTSVFYPEDAAIKWELGCMGAYTEDRQPALDELLLEPARHWNSGRFAVAGPLYPKSIRWPNNVKRFVHLSLVRQRAFYCAQKFTLNITRAQIIEAGYSPGVRLFEAAACGTPIISDFGEGLDAFLKPNEEILIANSSEESLYYLLSLTETERRKIGAAARRRVLASHTARHRAAELETYICDVLKPTTLA